MVGLLVEHVERPHHAIGRPQVGWSGVLGPASFGSLAGLDRRDDGVALVELEPHPQDGRAGAAGRVSLRRPFAEGAVGVSQGLDPLVPRREVGRLGADGLMPGDRHPRLLEALGVLAQIIAGGLDRRLVGDLELGGGHQADGRRDHVRLATRRRREPTARIATRLHVSDAAQDIRHRPADVLEHAQGRVGGAQARRLTDSSTRSRHRCFDEPPRTRPSARIQPGSAHGSTTLPRSGWSKSGLPKPTRIASWLAPPPLDRSQQSVATFSVCQASVARATF